MPRETRPHIEARLIEVLRVSRLSYKIAMHEERDRARLSYLKALRIYQEFVAGRWPID
jgi:hypothetical protein